MKINLYICITYILELLSNETDLCSWYSAMLCKLCRLRGCTYFFLFFAYRSQLDRNNTSSLSASFVSVCHSDWNGTATYRAVSLKSIPICFLDNKVSRVRDLRDKDTLNRIYYREVLEKIRTKSRRCPRLFIFRCCITTMHLLRCTVCKQVFRQKEYSCGSAAFVLARFEATCFFPQKWKNDLEQRHSGTVNNIRKVVTSQQKIVSVDSLKDRYQEWKEYLRRCVASQRNYF